MLAVCLLVGGNAWAEDYKSVLTLDFENAETYNSGWTATSANYDATVSQGDHGTGKAIYFASKGSRGSTTTYSFESLTSFVNATNYKIEFDFATCGGASGNNHEGGVKLYSGSTVVFSATIPAAWSAALTVTGAESTVTVAQRGTNPPTPWFHVILVGKSDGLYATVTNTTASPNVTIVNNVKISESHVNITSFEANNARALHHLYIDDIVCSVDLEAYKTRASAATTTYNSIKNEVMNPTQKSAIDAANTALAAFDTDDEIVADISGYVEAITALETANSNAENSVIGFSVLNDLITNAAAVTGYEAPTGAESVFSVNPGSDVDVAALTASVRAAIITAGTVNENTDITALIANSSFELGTTAGWVIVASDDTGARSNAASYATEGTDGSYLFNTWPKGTPIKQTIGTLPAGRYKLTAMVASNGATVFLTMNDQHNEGYTTVENDPFEETEYTFTLGSATEVTIGAVGGYGTTFTAEGHWWYKADKFTLTYLGEDPLEQAKAALNDEIDAATTVKDDYTAKVGTAPFLYPVATYNTLVTELTEATTVKNSGSTTVKDYTDAKDELEAAKEAMSVSSQNAPDPDKYYRIFVANNDGTASDYNMNMLKGATEQVKVTSTPYPVKITVDGGRYNINDPYGKSLCTDGNGTTAYHNGKENISARCAGIEIRLNDNGSVTLAGYRSSGNYQKYAASVGEGNGVTATNGNTGTWIISDAVEVTNVNLGVNATAGWGTFIAPYDNLTPSTVKAYTVSYTQNNTVFFAENETGVLSANTPYVLSTEEVENVSVAFKGIANNAEDTYTVNGLVGLLTAGTVPVNSYVMQYQAEVDGIAFYKVAEAMTGTKNRCYLDLSGVPTEPAGARADISFRLFDDETTGIKNLNVDLNNKVYDLQGRRVAQPTKGLYIVNGKKVVMK